MRASSVGGLAVSLVLIACPPARAGVADSILQGVIQGVAAGVAQHAVNSAVGPVAQAPEGYVVYARPGCEDPIDNDAAPPCPSGLTPAVAALVAARQTGGLSLAGYYNDPDLALASRYTTARAYAHAAPGGATVIVGAGGGYARYGHYSHGGAHFGGAHYASARFGGGVHVK